MSAGLPPLTAICCEYGVPTVPVRFPRPSVRDGQRRSSRSSRAGQSLIRRVGRGCRNLVPLIAALALEPNDSDEKGIADVPEYASARLQRPLDGRQIEHSPPLRRGGKGGVNSGLKSSGWPRSRTPLYPPFVRGEEFAILRLLTGHSSFNGIEAKAPTLVFVAATAPRTARPAPIRSASSGRRRSCRSADGPE